MNNKADGKSWPRLGVFFWVTGDAMEPEAEKYRSWGLSAVQLSGDSLAQCFAGPAEAARIRRMLEGHGLPIAATGAYVNLVAPDEAKRRSYLDHVKRALEVAPSLGTPVVATETGTRNRESDWFASPENAGEEAWSLLYRALDELLPVAAKHGSVLALEAYVNNVVQTYDQAAALLKKYDSPHLKLVLDPYNYLSKPLLPHKEKAVAGFLERFQPHFTVAHLKDVSPDGAEVDTPEFGTGVFPQALYLDFLKARRPDLAMILEHLPVENIPQAMSRVRDTIGKINQK